MALIKTLISKLFGRNKNSSLVINESKMKIDSNLENIFSKKDEDQKDEDQKDAITTTMAMHFLLQATADAEDARESGIKSGLIADWMTKEESIACFYAQYVFLGYEKKYSPMLVGNFIKKYCKDHLFLDFSSYYINIANAHGFEIDATIFDDGWINPVMDIVETAKHMKSVGYKKHWVPPFKDQYEHQWINS